MEFELSKDLRELQERARHFVDSELVPHELVVDEHEALPPETLARIRRRAIEYGLWPMNVPRELGGLGSSVLEQVIAQEQAGRATNGLWTHVGGPYNALLHCDAAQREKYLAPALRGEWTVSYAVTEPDAGSDTSNLATTAVPRGEGWVLNGE
jgi:alkylation response protein AidB-like acyl-CoA dehydrogenase